MSNNSAITKAAMSSI